MSSHSHTHTRNTTSNQQPVKKWSNKGSHVPIRIHSIEHHSVFIMKKKKNIDGIQIDEIKFLALKSFNQLKTRRNGEWNWK